MCFVDALSMHTFERWLYISIVVKFSCAQSYICVWKNYVEDSVIP